MTVDTEALRALHAWVLDRKPVVADLPEPLHAVASNCRTDTTHPLCRWAHDNLSGDDWNRIGAAWAEEERREKDIAGTRTLCMRGDEAELRTRFPGHAAYYDLVASPPVFEEHPVDAMVVIGISGSLVGKAKKVLERNMAGEGLKVQYGAPGNFSPNKYAARSNTDRFFMGYYTPEIEARMEAPRPDCERYRNNRYTQAGCRRDIVMSIVRDWLEARGHQSVRILVGDQSAWPHYDLLVERFLGDFDTSIDTNFDHRVSRNTSFSHQVCLPQRGPGLWIDYKLYVATLFPNG